MDPTIRINERVDVVSIYYASASERLICKPFKMRFRDEEILFTKLGMRHPTVQGHRMIHVFDVTDGINDYRLEHDAERLTWTLVSMIEGHYVKK
jgi:hypothetical protein